jgi:hypothetical protein
VTVVTSRLKGDRFGCALCVYGKDLAISAELGGGLGNYSGKQDLLVFHVQYAMIKPHVIMSGAVHYLNHIFNGTVEKAFSSQANTTNTDHRMRYGFLRSLFWPLLPLPLLSYHHF